MIVYIDVLIAVNFLITYFLLTASSVIAGYTYSRKRILIASLTGALFCLYIFVPAGNFFVDLSVKTASLLLCAVTAFGRTNVKKLMIQTGCFIILNILLMGMVISVSEKSSAVYHNNMFFYININPVILVTASAGIYLSVIFFSAVKEKISPDKVYNADIIFRDFSITDIGAFYDSGLKIKDIISNKDVILLSFEKVSLKLPEMLKNDVYNFLKGKYTDVKTVFVPVFFNTITGEGIIPSLKAEKIIIEGTVINNVLIGFVNNKLSENVTAIFGTDIKKQL